MRALTFRLGVAAMLLLASLCAGAQTPFEIGWSDVTANTSVSNYQTLQVATDEEGNTYTLEINTPLPGTSWTVMITDPYGDPIDEVDGSGSQPCRMAVDPNTEAVFVTSWNWSGQNLDGEQADGSRFSKTLPFGSALAIGADVVHGQVIMISSSGDVWEYACSEDGENGAFSVLDYYLAPWAVMIDSQGRVFAIGDNFSGNIFGSGYAAKCYDSAGNVTWAQFCNCTPTADNYFAALAEDPEGNMYLAIDSVTWNSNTNSNMWTFQVLGFNGGNIFETLNGTGRLTNPFMNYNYPVTQLAVADPSHVYVTGEGYLYFLNTSGEQWAIPQNWQTIACPNDGSGSVLAAWYDSANQLMRFNKYAPDGTNEYDFNYPMSSAAANTIGDGLEIVWSGSFSPTAYIAGNPSTATSSSQMTMEVVEGLALKSFSLPATVLSGTSFSATATLTATAASPYVVSVGGTMLINVPNGIRVQPNSSSGTASAFAAGVDSATPVTVQANDSRGVMRTARVTILPASLAGLSLSEGAAYTSNSLTGTVSLNGVAGPSGGTVTLSSDNSAAQVPASVTVAPQATSAQFTISTSLLTSPTTAHITATYKGVTQTQTLTLYPGTLGSLSPASTTVAGGTAVTLQVKFKGDVAAATPVTLSSSNSAVISVPVAVTIAKGGWTAYVNAKTAAVTTATPVTITATAGGVSVSSVITVNP